MFFMAIDEPCGNLALRAFVPPASIYLFDRVCGLQNTSLHGVNLFYSTPTEYTRAKLSYPITWPSVIGSDGFPYADGPHAYWSGFFTSRPALKGYVRACSAYFQSMKQLQVRLKSLIMNGMLSLF